MQTIIISPKQFMLILGKVETRHFFNIYIYILNKSLVSNAQVNSNIRKRQLPGSRAKTLLGKIQALKFIKPHVQGTSLCTWGVICRELCSNYQKLLGHLKLGKNHREG